MSDLHPGNLAVIGKENWLRALAVRQCAIRMYGERRVACFRSPVAVKSIGQIVYYCDFENASPRKE